MLKLDVTQAEDVKAAIKPAVVRFGRIDVLVNSAGIGYFAAIEERVRQNEQPRRHDVLEYLEDGRQRACILFTKEAEFLGERLLTDSP